MAIKILDVGQCGFDGPRMTRLFESKLGAEVSQAATGDEASEAVADQTFDLILVNRVLAADSSSGLEVIEQLIADGCEAPIALVSDRPDAQEEAVKLGAVRGFGKAELNSPKTLELVKELATGKSKDKS